LTGILNRRFFIEKAEAEIKRMRRFPGKFTLLLLDIDHFKGVNDTYGHAAGDEILRAVAQHLSAELRVNDMVARHGGEEFVLLLPETPLEKGLLLAERLRNTLASAPIHFGSHEIAITISIGAAESNGHEELDRILQRADEALYQAKREGRNRIIQARPQEMSQL
jgi:diguanylate cyclase (GGDEF)-like protein